MCAAWPKRILSLVLADSFAEHPDGRGIYERGLAASDNMRALAESRVDVLLAQPADPQVRSEVVETMARIEPAAYRIGAKAVWLADQRDRAADIRVPTLVLCGAEDRITPPALSNALAKLIPGAHCDVIERAGHLSNLEQPAEFNALVGAFIRGVDSRNG
jgi:3-oxoadipate enol-lactonase